MAGESTAYLILDVMRASGHTSRSNVVHVPMREGEKPGVNLVADMSYWDSVGLKNEVPFEASIRKTLKYMSQLPVWHLKNALRFYGKAV